MRVTCDRKALLAAMGAVSGVVPSRSPKPILTHVLLTADADGATLSATDLEIGICHVVLGVKVDDQGSAVLPAAKFTSILSASNDAEMWIETQDDAILVQGKHAKYRLPSEDPNLFPQVPAFDAGEFYSIEAAALRLAIRRTQYATDAESTRYALSGTLCDVNGGVLTMVGTDGRRLAMQPVDVVPVNGCVAPDPLPVVPLKALRLLDRILSDSVDIVRLAFEAGRSVRVQTDQATIYSRLVEGRFPRYGDVVPPTWKSTVTITAGSLNGAVAQASILTSDESRGVDFAFADDVLTLSASNAIGSAQIQVPIEFSDEPVSVSLDPRFVAEALKPMDPATELTLRVSDSKTAVVVLADDGFQYVVMPLSRDR